MQITQSIQLQFSSSQLTYSQSVKPKKTPPIAAKATLNLILASTPATLPAAFGFVVEVALAPLLVAEPVALPVALVAEAV